MKKNITHLEVNNKKVLVRVDFNVPIKKGKIMSDARIKGALPTIEYLLNKNAKVIIISHLGRPKGEVKKEFSLKPVATRLEELLNKKVHFAKDTIGQDAESKVEVLKPGEVLVLENIRFLKEEKTADKQLAEKLASLADVYVNDAFATSHRKHTSMVEVAKLLPNAVGFLVQKELDSFDKALKNPKRPFTAILGGAKVEDKLEVIENLLNVVDALIIGGGMSYTFLKAIGGSVGNSIVDDSKLDYCYDIIKKAVNKGVKLLLPVDDVCNTSFDSKEKPKVFASGNTPEGYMALDIGPKSVRLFNKQIKKSKTICWNGPLGVFENSMYSNGTQQVAKKVAKSKAFTIIGGGDTISALEKFDLEEYINHLSTGGGASLKLLEGKTLPAIEVIEEA